MKVRENWIDWAKSIGIMLVIMGHYGMGDKIYGTPPTPPQETFQH